MQVCSGVGIPDIRRSRFCRENLLTVKNAAAAQADGQW